MNKEKSRAQLKRLEKSKIDIYKKIDELETLRNQYDKELSTVHELMIYIKEQLNKPDF